VGSFAAFFDGFHSEFLKPGDRVEGGAQIALINADGSGFHELTSGADNNASPSYSVSGRPPVFGAPAPSDGLGQCWTEGRAPVVDGGASADSPGGAPSRPPPEPLDSWPSAPGISRRPRSNRCACPAALIPDRYVCAATPTPQPLPAPYPFGPPHAPVRTPARFTVGLQDAAPDCWPPGTWLGVRPTRPAPARSFLPAPAALPRRSHRGHCDNH